MFHHILRASTQLLLPLIILSYRFRFQYSFIILKIRIKLVHDHLPAFSTTKQVIIHQISNTCNKDFPINPCVIRILVILYKNIIYTLSKLHKIIKTELNSQVNEHFSFLFNTHECPKCPNQLPCPLILSNLNPPNPTTFEC